MLPRTFLLSLLLLLPILRPAIAAEPFSVMVSGIDGSLRENVEAALVLPHGFIRDGRVEPAWASRFSRQAVGKAAWALEPFGYYAAVIRTELTRGENGEYLLTVDVSPGEPVRVARREVALTGAGAQSKRLKRLATDFPLAPGDPMRHDLYEQAKGELLATATELGYLDAAYVRHEVRIDRAARRAVIDLQLETGERYRFGDVTLSGADDFPETFLRRHLDFTPGDPYSESRLARTQANLLDADRFNTVSVVAHPELVVDRTVPVRIELQPAPQYQLRPGIGYGTDTGARGRLKFRNINAFHLGHELQSELLWGEFIKALSGRYLVPLGEQTDRLMAFSAKYNEEDNDSFDSSTLSAEGSLTHGLAKGFKATLFVELLQERYAVGKEDRRNSLLVMPGVRFGQRRWKFDSPGQPRSGYTWQFEIRGSSTTLGSDVSLVQGILGGTTILPLTEGLHLILRVEGGTTYQDTFADVPASMRFFAGGDQSVRGYGYKSLGPKDSSGDVTGGRHLAIGSVECEQQLSENWGIALFYDLGNAFDSFNDMGLRDSLGIGVRRRTPIGPVKVDLARQLGGDNDYRLHLTVGFGW